MTCRMITPIFEAMAKENPDVTFIQEDVDNASDVAAEAGVSCMPTFMFYKGGKRRKGQNSVFFEGQTV